MSNHSSYHHKSIKDNSTIVSHGHITQDQNLDFMQINTSNKQINKPSKNINRSMVCSNNLIKSTNMRRSLKDSEKTQHYQQSNPSFLQTKTESINKLHKQHQVLSLQMSDNFKCQNCKSSNQTHCPLCLGNKIITKDSALVKFFSYLIQFKFGRNDSYVPANQTQELKDPASKVTINKDKLRMSLNQRKSQCLNIHYSYFCNECNANQPIQGSRFQCLICEDYDLCESCYRSKGHQHSMNEIKQSCSYRSSIKCIQKINKAVEIFSSRKMHSLRNRIINMQEKIYKSSLR